MLKYSMRNIFNLFSLKDYLNIEVFYIGTTKYIYTKYNNYNQLLALIKYCNICDGVILMVDKLENIYMFNELIFDISKLYLIIFFEN